MLQLATVSLPIESITVLCSYFRYAIEVLRCLTECWSEGGEHDLTEQVHPCTPTSKVHYGLGSKFVFSRARFLLIGSVFTSKSSLSLE